MMMISNSDTRLFSPGAQIFSHTQEKMFRLGKLGNIVAATLTRMNVKILLTHVYI